MSKRTLEISNDIFFNEVESELLAGKTVTIPMRGVSMLPLLKEGRDSVRLKGVGFADLKKGDVVLFHHNGRFVLHRLIAKKDGRLNFRGDGLLGKGEVCGEKDTVAVVTHVMRKHGRVISVSSLRWKLSSWLWLLARPLALRINHFRHVL